MLRSEYIRQKKDDYSFCSKKMEIRLIGLVFYLSGDYHFVNDRVALFNHPTATAAYTCDEFNFGAINGLFLHPIH